MTFREFVKEQRIKKDITLRHFCRNLSIDPSNWSKVENGIANAPSDRGMIYRIAAELKLNDNEFRILKCLAMMDLLSPEKVEEENILEKLPILFTDKKPTRAQLDKLYEVIKKSISR